MPRPPADGTGPAEPLPRDEQDEAVSHSDAGQTPEEILAYWTPERMAQARPREIRLPGAESGPEAEGQPADN
jgi:hypothetical protein